MLLISIIALLFSIFFMFERLSNKFYIILFTLFSTASLFLIFTYYVSNSLTNNGFDESIIFHIKMGLAGSDLFDFWLIILYSVFFIFVIVLTTYIIYKKTYTYLSRKNNNLFVLVSLGLLSLSYISNPIINDFMSFYARPNNEAFFDYYRIPFAEVKKISKKKNIVYVYAESLERTYFDEKIFPNLITDLKELEQQSISFQNISQVYATGWTIAGMTASQCGIPLITPSGGNSMSGIKNNFLPGIKCLGDLLKENGYTLEYFGGSSVKFAGKDNFYLTHSFSKVQGKEELLPFNSNPSYVTGWGLYDDTLLDIVYQEFETLSKKEQPFGLFTLTLDTHHPVGHSSQTCKEKNIIYQDGSNSMLNAVKCSDYLISKFVKKILASPYARDTVVVVSSDHLAMPNDAYEYLENGKRRDLFFVIDGAQVFDAKVINTKGSMLDIAPTLLGILGFNGNMGLGRNLLSESSLLNDSNIAENLSHKDKNLYETLTDMKLQQLNVLNLNMMLSSWRKYFLNFWNFPLSSNGIKINTTNQTVETDTQILNYPLVFQLTEKNTLLPRFSFNEKGTTKDQISRIPIETSFIWIDKCCYMEKNVNVKLPNQDICIGIGNKKDDFIYISKLDDNLTLSGSTLLSLLRNDNSYDDINFNKMKYSTIDSHLDLDQCFTERCHSKNLQPEDIIRQYTSVDTIILFSVYHLHAELLSYGIHQYMKDLNSKFSTIGYEDLYFGIIKNNKLIMEKSSNDNTINAKYDIEKYTITIRTEGLKNLFKSSIMINDIELSPNYPGLNMVVLNFKTGQTYSYSFPTYNVWLGE